MAEALMAPYAALMAASPCHHGNVSWEHRVDDPGVHCSRAIACAKQESPSVVLGEASWSH